MTASSARRAATRRARSGLRWVVDPLDGTTNFLFRLPQWAVSIACEDADGAVVGVVYDPPRDEMWTAVRGGPALRDGEPVRASERTELADGAGRHRLRLRRRRAPRAGGARRRAAAATCATSAASAPPRSTSRGRAAGRYDAYFERGINHWDIAAGALICERAGLVVEDRCAAAPPEADGHPRRHAGADRHHARARGLIRAALG